MSRRSSDGPGSGLPPIKAIGSLAKKQSDVTRQGTQKLKFVPTLPSRRKKEEANSEPTHVATSISLPGSRSGGRVDSRGKERARGASRPDVEMTASGPFAMGPTIAGYNITRRNALHPDLTSLSMPVSASNSVSSQSSAKLSTSKVENSLKGADTRDEEVEVYSDPEEGIEIMDIGSVRHLDFMAPETLRKKTERTKVAKQELDVNIGLSSPVLMGDDGEVSENLFENFATMANFNQAEEMRKDPIYSFHFPAPFPSFALPGSSYPQTADGGARLMPDIAATTNASQVMVDGVIGRLEFYRAGVVKMRLSNGIVFDVTAATQPSFFQQAVYLDKNGTKLLALGEVTKRFSVSPNIDILLSAVELANHDHNLPLQSEDLIPLDAK